VSDWCDYICAVQNTSYVPRPEQGHRFIGTSGIAKRLGKSIKTVHRWVEAGHLQPIGRLENGAANDALIFLLSDIEEYAERAKQGSPRK